MLLTYRFKLMPTRSQYSTLDRLCEDQRQLYNAALQERVDAWKKAKVSISKIDQFKSLTEIRGFSDTYKDVPVALSRWTIAKVADAFTGFFSRLKKGGKAGFPRFRSKGRWKSFGFSEYDGFRVEGERLIFKPFKNGLKLHLHRPLPEHADMRNCTLTKIGRHWFVNLVMSVPVAQQHKHPNTTLGIDVGIEYLLTTSHGVQVDNPRIGVKHARAIRVAQRALARCRKGSNRRRKVREKLARLQRAVARQRSTYLHQVSASLTRTYAFIAVEKLQVKNMTASAKGTVDEPGKNVRQKAGLNRAFLDTSPSTLIDYLTYKAERAGGEVVKVNPHYTSQDCSSCGKQVKKSLSQRTHRCACGAILHRDHNAARNIERRALIACGRAMPPGGANARRRPERRPGNMVCEAA